MDEDLFPTPGEEYDIERQIVLTKVNIIKKVYYLILLTFSFSLPFGVPNNQLSNILMFVLLALGIYILIKERGTLGKSDIVVLFLYSGLYIIHLAGLIGSDNINEAYYELDKKIPFLAAPWALACSSKVLEKKCYLVLWSFVAGCILATLICFCYAVYNYIVSNDLSYFEYHTFSEIIHLQPGYLAIYICFAISILIIGFTENSNLWLLRVFVIGWLGLIVIILSARMQIIISSVIILVSIVRYFKQSLIKTFFGLLFASVCLLIIIFSFPQNRYRLKEAINPDPNRWGEQQIRGSIWPCAIETVSKSSYLGVGLGDVKDELERCYIERNYTSLTYWEGVRFNAHNQYLETLVGLGVPGLLYFLTMLGYLFFLFKQNKSYLGYYLLFILMMSFLTESVLERQRGILVFATFIPFIIFNKVNRQS